MNYIIAYLIFLFTLFLLSYLCFSFIMGDSNAMNWGKDIRIDYIISLLAIIAVTIPIFMIIAENLIK